MGALAVGAAPGEEERAMCPTSRTEPVPSFEALARRPDGEIDVALGAALIAKDVYPSLDVADVLRRLDALAGPLDGGALAGLPSTRQAEEVSARFRELGFRGNVDDYYDPRNSLLTDVLERRVGIPITLTLVWCEIARRAGVFARGVGFPGHFLARVDELEALGGRSGAPPVIVDPFAGGRILGDKDAQELVVRTLGAGAELHPLHFEATSPRATLARMLTNLKSVWAGRGDHARAFVAIDRIVTLTPDAPRALRERAAVALRLGLRDLARADLERVVALDPQAPDVPTIEERLRGLRPARPSALN